MRVPINIFTHLDKRILTGKEICFPLRREQVQGQGWDGGEGEERG